MFQLKVELFIANAFNAVMRKSSGTIAFRDLFSLKLDDSICRNIWITRIGMSIDFVLRGLELEWRPTNFYDVDALLLYVEDGVYPVR